MVFVAGGLTASFYGWLPLYLPELFGTNVRATGQGFSFNFGRIFAGVGGIDSVLLVVAADESIKPQTREHFSICRLLAIRTGVVAITNAARDGPGDFLADFVGAEERVGDHRVVLQ